MGGCLKDPYHIEVDPAVQPVIHAPREIPLAFQDRVRSELMRMEGLRIIAKVDKPSARVSSMVIVEKPNGDLRICLDPRDLNAAIRREHYRLPTIDDETSKVTGATHFSVLDARYSFWQIYLDEASSNLCVFNTPYGRYKFLRMPFGIRSAPEVFQKRVTQIFGDLPGVTCYIDDILAWGSTKIEHDIRLQQVLAKAAAANLRFNRDKCKFDIPEIKYLGHVVSSVGVHVDTDKVRAITEMASPKNRKELQTFLGMVTFLAECLPNLNQCRGFTVI